MYVLGRGGGGGGGGIKDVSLFSVLSIIICSQIWKHCDCGMQKKKTKISNSSITVPHWKLEKTNLLESLGLKVTGIFLLPWNSILQAWSISVLSLHSNNFAVCLGHCKSPFKQWDTFSSLGKLIDFFLQQDLHARSTTAGD